MQQMNWHHEYLNFFKFNEEHFLANPCKYMLLVISLNNKEEMSDEISHGSPRDFNSDLVTVTATVT